MSIAPQDAEKQWTRWRNEWDEAAWYFTYMDEDDKSKPVLQGGLVAIFYIIGAAEPERRKALADTLVEFEMRYGQRLNWGGGWGAIQKNCIQPRCF